MIKNKLTKLPSVLCTLYSVLPSVLCTLYSVLLITACTEEDLVQPANGETASLRIASVTIDGQQVARSRAAYDGTDETDSPYNRTFAAFATGDALNVWYSFGDIFDVPAYATLGADGTWAMTSDNAGSTPITIKPGKGNLGSQKWEDAFMRAAFCPITDVSLSGEAALAEAEELGAVQGTIPTENIILMADNLYATTSQDDQQNYGVGTITIDSDVKSPTLGEVKIEFKHYDLALLRLPVEAVSIEPGTYIVNGTACNVTGLGTLWAEVSKGYDDLDGYYPLTRVTIDGVDYLQAIVTAYQSGSQTLTGFKAVMKVNESGEMRDENGEMRDENGEMGDESGNENSPLSTLHSTLTLDLPFTVGTGNSSPESGEVPQAEGSVTLRPNTRYPLTLTIAPTHSTVTLTAPLGKPGWGTDEEELSNLPNELDDMIVTIDGTPYLRLDPTQTTDVATVKTLLQLAIEQKGITHLCVTGETLAAYDGGYAKTVVGEAIRTGGFADGTLTLLLPDATAIGAYAFESCHALASVSAPKATVIGANAFAGCTALTDVSLPEVTEIDTSVFARCTALTSVELPKATTIGDYAFDNCYTLTSIELPAATTIGKNAFRTCGALESVSLPKVTEIGAYAFEGCILTNVESPSITTIGSNAFSGCAIFGNLSLPSVIEIGAYAFESCTLANVEFPSITTIGSNAFSGGNIGSLSFGSVIESVGTDAFSDVPTETCYLTLVAGQESHETYPADVANKTWAGYTWQSITLISTNE